MDYGALPVWVVLDPVPVSVSRARCYARQVLGIRATGGLTRTAEVVVSELVTNAVNACGAMTRPCPLLLWVLHGRGGVLVVVWDSSPLRPVLSLPGEGAESGRGLMLVEALSERWGWQAAAGGGKFVWAVLRRWPWRSGA